MLTLPSSVRIYVAAEPVDLRRGFDGLAATTRTLMLKNPMSGHVFVFVNRRRNRIKLLVWDRPGWLLPTGVQGHPVLRSWGTPSFTHL